MLPWFLSEIPWLVITGNSSLNPFYAAVIRALVASIQLPDSPITSPRYWKFGTASNLSLLTCTWVEFKLLLGTLSPLHFLHLNMLSFFSVPLTSEHLLWIQRLQVWQKYWVCSNSFGTHAAGPLNISCLLLNLTRQTKRKHVCLFALPPERSTLIFFFKGIFSQFFHLHLQKSI